ncbi:hypothetical protein LTS13_000823 [Exophiala xenobiotica]|nr:hypothetical protein LTR41_003950 [Exophiala xenobiotica]KAK5302060.1 hypothetical protein LTR14_000308 [Exophiala xenobiotica]KAK5387887.1 hypothetical protein LTS13_000823 [Exophiala xenobiotica]KAK5397976.1 hypothetical protein LTR79_004258 [Exophiala xenobiotica]KAK5417955.1 hypothetical protein LTR90_005129 [Exophiala xenobiotica]
MGSVKIPSSSSSSTGLETPPSCSGDTDHFSDIEFDTETLLSQLALDEKVALIRGSDMWHTTPIPRLRIPSLRVSDGPNGVRGTRFFDGTPGACLPCGTGLGATWDTGLVRRLGNLLGLEAKSKGAHILLGPTVNIQRSPLGGRGFEFFGEDPVLSGLLAAAYCNGVQDEHIITAIKHFVCNDQEDKRMSVNITVSDRALREIYLLPFMLAIRDSNPGAIMTAYNKLNGTHCSENVKLLRDILRGEWGWQGLLMSDWYGTYSTCEAIAAGLDLEMPGPSRWRDLGLTHAVNCGKLDEKVIDDRARNVLEAVQKAGKSGIPQGCGETTLDTPGQRSLLREAAADSVVLLKNSMGTLPLQKSKSTAVIGSNVRVTPFCGGGSASLNAHYSTSILESVQRKCDDVRYAEGPFSHLDFSLRDGVITDTKGNPGFTFRCYLEPPEVKNRELIDTMYVRTSKFFLSDYSPPKLNSPLFWAEMEATLVPDKPGPWSFGLCTHGTARLFVDGIELIDNETHQEPGNTFLGAGTKEVMGTINLEAGRHYRLLITFGSAPTSKLVKKGVVTFRKGGVRLRGGPEIVVSEAMTEAVRVAKAAEQVVVVVGLNGDWEIEGQDRATMDLPPHTNDLINRILDVRPDAVIVTQSGTPVRMPWASNAASMLHMWYGGNEVGNGIADVLFGDVNPGGKLPMTFPKRMQDCPAYLNSKADAGRMLYGENIYVGYRYYEAVEIPVQFPFGWGLSYTTFAFSNLKLRAEGSTLSIHLRLTNTGTRPGSEVVQMYVGQRDPNISRPKKELKGFQKCRLGPEEGVDVALQIPMKYATSYWDEHAGAWMSDAGTYDVLVGSSSREADCLHGVFETAITYSWNGL